MTTKLLYELEDNRHETRERLIALQKSMKPGLVIELKNERRFHVVTQKDVDRLARTIENLSKPWTDKQAAVVRERISNMKIIQ